MEGCDLSDEDFEEIRMLTSFRPITIKRVRKKFLTYVEGRQNKRLSQQSNRSSGSENARPERTVHPEAESTTGAQDTSSITRDQFLMIPTIAVNPLKDQIALCFGFKMGRDVSKEAGEQEGPIDDPPLSGNGSLINLVEHISFKDFMVALSVFNAPGKKEKKLEYAFKIHDFDQDGRIGRDDLICYFKKTMAMASVDDVDEPEATTPEGEGEDSRDSAGESNTAAPRDDPEVPPELQGGDESSPAETGPSSDSESFRFSQHLEKLADSVLREATTDDATSLSFEDFKRVVAPSDFESRLFITLD